MRYFFTPSGKYNRMEFSRNGERVQVEGAYVVAVNDSNAYLAAGMAGLGVLHTLRFMVQDQLDAGSLVPVLDEWTAQSNTLSVVYMSNRHLSARVRAFVEWLEALFKQHPHVLP